MKKRSPAASPHLPPHLTWQEPARDRRQGETGTKLDRAEAAVRGLRGTAPVHHSSRVECISYRDNCNISGQPLGRPQTISPQGLIPCAPAIATVRAVHVHYSFQHPTAACRVLLPRYNHLMGATTRENPWAEERGVFWIPSVGTSGTHLALARDGASCWGISIPSCGSLRLLPLWSDLAREDSIRWTHMVFIPVGIRGLRRGGPGSLRTRGVFAGIP